jgi:hypothetical protein
VEPAELAGDESFQRMVPSGEENNRLEYGLDLRPLVLVAEPRVERYWQFLSLLKGQKPSPPAVPAFEWLLTALRAHR